MALFAVKWQGHDTMLVVEAATAEAADGWLVFRSADGQPLASLRVEEVLGLETVAPGGAGPHPEPSSWLSDEIHDVRRNELARSQQAARVAEHA